MAEYIEREALEHHFMTKRRYLTKDLVMDAAYEVSKFPAADVAPVVHGRWDAYWNGDYVMWCHKCSICSSDALTVEETMHDEVLSPYCPNCGARMDGE